MDLTQYERIIGLSSSEVLVEDTIEFVNSEFENSPSYRKIEIDGVESGCIFHKQKKSNEAKLTLRPSTEVNKGMYILLEGNHYIATEAINHAVYPKAEIELCNNTLRWRDDLNVLHEYPCVVSGSGYEFDEPIRQETKLVMKMSKSELDVKVKYDEATNSISPNQRFVFNGNVYDVSEIDSITNVYKDKGYITIGVMATEKTTTDDTNDGVADDSGNSGWGDW